MSTPSEPFWMVYGWQQSEPRIVHTNYDSARSEAERLARNNPGIHFYVLATVGCALKTDVEFRTIDADEISF